MLHPIRRYASIGRCIYCGDTEKPRGEEHIVARALAGNRIIFDDASCRDCETMINRSEQPAHKAIFGPMRAKFGLHGKRRKGKKPATHVALSVLDKHPKDGGRPFAKIAVPASAYPVWFIGLVMQQPTLLRPARPDTPHYKLWMRYDSEMPPPLRLKNRALEVGAINPLIFAQVLAKIAYGYAVAEYGYGTFLSLLHPLLQGKTDDFSDVVGGDPEIPPGRDDVLFHLRLAEVQKAGGLTYVVVEIRLWAMLGTPNYRVVVGILSPNFVKDPAHGADIEVPGH